MRSRNGFTLTELLAVIAIIAILTLMVVPAAIKTYNENVIKAMHVQESEIKNSANLYVQDYCDDPIDDSDECPISYDETNSYGEKYVCLSDLQDVKTIKKVKYKGDSCKGIIVYKKDTDTDLYSDASVYLYCGDSDKGEYSYVTDESINPINYSRCKINTNNELHYIWLMEEKLTDIHSILQREYELNSLASANTNVDDAELYKKEMLDLISEINNIYNFKYLDSMILHKDNDLTGKYVVKVVSSSGLGLDDLTFSDYTKDAKTIENAMQSISYFRSSLGAEQNAYDNRLNFNKCSNKSCKLGVVNDTVKRISEDAYGAAYNGYDEADLITYDLEVQKLFDNLDMFSKNLGDSSISRNSIFPNGKDVLTKENAIKVYQDAQNYIKNNANK